MIKETNQRLLDPTLYKPKFITALPTKMNLGQVYEQDNRTI